MTNSFIRQVAGVVVGERGTELGSAAFQAANNVFKKLTVSNLTTGMASNLASARSKNPMNFFGGVSDLSFQAASSVGKFITRSSLPGFTKEAVANLWGKSGAQIG